MRKRILLQTFLLLFALVAVCTVNAQQVFKTTTSSVIGYLEYVPQGYNNTSDKYPIVIFLHGIGERGANSTDPAELSTTINTVAKIGPPMFVKNGYQFPFILISPQLKNNFGTWPAWYVKEVIDHVKSYLKIDERRIYLTGLSLGGGGVWMTAQDFPEFFAAIAPVCGGYNTPSKACNIAGENLPVWAFHGDKDTVVPLSRSTNMVNAINACLPTPSPLAKMTIYTGVGHSAWNNAYKTDNSVHNPNVYQWMLSFTNVLNNGDRIPTANAGADKTVSTASTTLTASATDDGTIVSYIWTKLDGPSVALTNQSAKTLTVSNLVAGEYLFRVVVTDNVGNTDSDYVNLTVTNTSSNEAPVVYADRDKGITLPYNTLSLFGSATDADGSVSEYAWTKISGPAATMSNAATKTLKLTNLVQGTYVFRLTATDDKGATGFDEATVTVKPVNVLPVANAGADKTITLPTNSVTLTGTATDADGSIAKRVWTKVSGPLATLSGTTVNTLTVSGMAEGVYIFRFTVTDNKNASHSDDVAVTVKGTSTASNTLPVADAGPDTSITLPTNSISIVGSGGDADGSITAYAWTKVSGSSATLNGINSCTLTASDLVAGTYTFRLTVTDNQGGKKSDDVVVVVNPVPAANIAPVANAGANKIVILPSNSVTITGTATDADGTIVSYSWRKSKGGSAILANANTPTVTVTGLEAGAYYFKMTVTDDKGATHADDMMVTVKDGIAGTYQISTWPSATNEYSGELASADEKILNDLTRKDLHESTVIIYNATGKQIYSGSWNLKTYQRILDEEGVYIYNVIKQGRRVDSGKIFIQG